MKLVGRKNILRTAEWKPYTLRCARKPQHEIALRVGVLSTRLNDAKAPSEPCAFRSLLLTLPTL
jgi:hypothetical protein